ncbi:gamma-glutamylcyclotransferase [Rhodobacterales bacterium HKCCE3408]|nr:gamma-glutamylcyclotransferase [Rhodobacterales bacterium HKCCE3408]
MQDPFFFGYGSLVNRATHDYPRAAPARATGWRRQWKKTRLRKLAFLTVTEAPGVEIDGLIAAVPDSDWAALDLREAAYLREPLREVAHAAGDGLDIHIYRTRPEHDTDATDDHPILASYLDTVLLGFLREYGEDGVARFVATTEGWEAPLFDDRAAPRYPRFEVPGPEARALIDDHLAPLRLRLIRAR